MLCLALSLLTAQVIDLGQKETLLVIRMSPKAQENPLSTERLFRIATRALGEESRLSLSSAEQAGVDEGRLAECELDRRLSCWATEVRGTADHLLVLSMLEEKDGSLEVTGFLVDISAARDKTENEIFEKTTVSRGTIRMDSDEDLVSYFRELLRPITEGEQTGSIAIEVDVPELSIAVDGDTVGIARAGTTTLRGVVPGQHTIVLRDPKHEEAIHSRSIEVLPNAVVELRFETTPEEPDLLRTVSLWSGVAVAVAGVAIAAVAIAVAPDAELIEPCVGFGCEPMSEGRFHRAGGVLLAPLGYSLIGTGGIVALGSALMPDGDLWIYLSIAAGIVLGAASYGISAAFW